MGKKKFYVVWEGNQTGIFNTWEECKCKRQIHGYPKAKYKSFKSLELAKQAHSESYYDYAGKDFFVSELSEEERQLIGDPILNSISVDAACSGNPGPMEYQGVETSTQKSLFKLGPFEDCTVNIGEFLALVHALAEMKKRKDNRPIYSDSKIALSWVKKKRSNSALTVSDKNSKIFELLERAENWLEKNSYSNPLLKWETKAWGEIPADFGRKK